MGPNFWVFWTGVPLELNLKPPNPTKARISKESRRLSHKACKSDYESDLQAASANKRVEMSQNRDISPHINQSLRNLMSL